MNRSEFFQIAINVVALISISLSALLVIFCLVSTYNSDKRDCEEHSKYMQYLETAIVEENERFAAFRKMYDALEEVTE